MGRVRADDVRRPRGRPRRLGSSAQRRGRRSRPERPTWRTGPRPATSRGRRGRPRSTTGPTRTSRELDGPATRPRPRRPEWARSPTSSRTSSGSATTTKTRTARTLMTAAGDTRHLEHAVARLVQRPRRPAHPLEIPRSTVARGAGTRCGTAQDRPLGEDNVLRFPRRDLAAELVRPVTPARSRGLKEVAHRHEHRPWAGPLDRHLHAP